MAALAPNAAIQSYRKLEFLAAYSFPVDRGTALPQEEFEGRLFRFRKQPFCRTVQYLPRSHAMLPVRPKVPMCTGRIRVSRRSSEQIEFAPPPHFPAAPPRSTSPRPPSLSGLRRSCSLFVGEYEQQNTLCLDGVGAVADARIGFHCFFAE